jgi:hypothetical protein
MVKQREETERHHDQDRLKKNIRINRRLVIELFKPPIKHE